ncbi:MAG TPA: glycosyltransferase family 2 protein [Phycisphaerae bacterium]|nr:glycosyltransferase family 2 protein [Phycisphaerae bacterium]
MLWSVSFVFFWVWLAALVLAIWAARIAQRFGVRLPRKVQREVEAERYPRVAVILPIKGVDDDTLGNVRALLEQDYPAYRLIFVVESEEDPVVALLEKVAQEESRVELVVAGLAEHRGQKVHNQLAGVERTTERDEILAFMDADAKPAPHWVHNLVMPLTYGEHIGATTGYRYYIPVTPHTANKIVSVLNAMVGALLGPYRRTFAWGGSMAIRRNDFFGYGLHDLWQGALSDDYVLSYCVKSVAKRKIQFVAQCLVASDANFNWASLFEFAVRQYRITKVCAPWVWMTAVGGAALYLTAFCYTLFNVIYGFTGAEALHGEHLRQMAMFAGLYGTSMLRGYLLVLGGERMLPEHKEAIRSTMGWATVGMPWCFVINLVALIGSGIGRTIVWRGVTYRMVSRLKTEVLRPRGGVVEKRRAEVVGRGD